MLSSLSALRRSVDGSRPSLGQVHLKEQFSQNTERTTFRPRVRDRPETDVVQRQTSAALVYLEVNMYTLCLGRRR